MRTSTSQRALIVFLITISAIGFALRVNESLRIFSLAHPDEVFQTLEPAHRVAYGYGVITWEWRDGIRSWLFPVFLAGMMKCTDRMAKGSTGYLVSIRILLSALSMTTIWFGFVWSRRTSGAAAAIVGATACATWYELVGFAPRAMPEVVATHLLLVGLYLGVCLKTSSEQRRLFLAGILCGIAMSLRIQLGPVVVFSGLYFCRGRWKERLPTVMGGILLSVCVFGITDAVTWHHPFQSMYLYFWENEMGGKSLLYGSEPWYWYIGELTDHLGPLIILALVGVRRSPFLGWIALIILGSHSFIAHKEIRFIYPALPIIIVLSSIGLCEIVEGIGAHLEVRWISKGCVPVGVLVFMLTSVLLSFRFPYWSAASGGMMMFNKLSQSSTACGVGLYSVPWTETGGYTYLHRPIPITFVEEAEIFSKEAPTFNALVAGEGVFIPGGEFVLEECRMNVRLYRRPGPCAPPEENEMNNVLRQTGN